MTKIACFLIAAVGYSSVAMAATQTVTLNVPGMKCSSCPVTLKKALMKIDGVEHVITNFEKREAVVTFDSNKTDVEKLTLATAGDGYPATSKAEHPSTFAYDSERLAAALESLSPKTVPEWQKKAEAGDPLAQNVMGMAYKYGRVIQQDHALSLHWFQKAAEQGDADAQFNLGRIYGKATGRIYGKQRAAPRNDVTAAYWYRKAAEQNYAPAQFNLAQMYAEGSPTFPRDLAHAYFWLQQASANDDPNASEQLKRVEGELSTAEKNRAHHLAAEWKKRQR